MRSGGWHDCCAGCRFIRCVTSDGLFERKRISVPGVSRFGRCRRSLFKTGKWRSTLWARIASHLLDRRVFSRGSVVTCLSDVRGRLTLFAGTRSDRYRFFLGDFVRRKIVKLRIDGDFRDGGLCTLSRPIERQFICPIRRTRLSRCRSRQTSLRIWSRC